ncbi:MAG: hypothetical protein COV67_13090 [Nitrospinae bacterium CG11_big_fil_rev_8_21_14_0_20_56_8]|nr:MAG: hypothetical protein COV67_13090 [Nitrospinae bacterium CG11_big_fil_rev_8_21_14_0_20_56_8]
MKRLVYWFNFFYLFGLALWVGGMFLLGILVEVMVRVNLKEDALKASTIMNRIMDVFNVHIIYSCIGLMLTAELVRFLVARYGKAGYQLARVTRWRWTRETVLGIMIVLALYMGSVLRPEMHEVDRAKKANPSDVRLQVRFDRFHSWFVNIYTVNMILGLSLFYIHGKEMARFREDGPDSGS